MPKKMILYRKGEEGGVEMLSVDAREALTNAPDEWSPEPWAKAQAKAEVKLLPEMNPDQSENLPVNRAITTEPDGTVTIAPGNEEGPPPEPRPGSPHTARRRS